MIFLQSVITMPCYIGMLTVSEEDTKIMFVCLGFFFCSYLEIPCVSAKQCRYICV